MNALGYPVLKCKTPVPSDIQVSQDIVKEVGLLSMADLAKQYVVLDVICVAVVVAVVALSDFFLFVFRQADRQAATQSTRLCSDGGAAFCLL
jgi:hypothetical protein